VLVHEEEEDTILHKRAFEKDEKALTHLREMEERQIKLQEQMLEFQKDQAKQRVNKTKLFLL
jgi:hypothetical protein